MDSFETNPDHASLPPINVGDIVYVKSNDGLGYSLRCVVEEISQDSLAAKAVAAYTVDDSPINSGHGTELVGTSLLIKRQAVHKVVKAPGGQV